MSDINDKYNKLKIEFEKQKQYYIQLTINLRSQKRQLTNSINNNSTKNINFTDFQISHFSHIYQNKNPSKKKMKLKSDNNHNNSKELKKLKEEFANYKKDTTTEIENKNKELELKNKELEQIKMELNNSKENYEKKIEDLTKELKDMTDENNKLKNERQKLIDDYNKKMHILNEDLKKMMIKNQKMENLEKEVENLQKKNKSYNMIINQQKSEIDRLKKNSQLNFKLIKEDNENLLKQINLLNVNFLHLDNNGKKNEEKSKTNK